MRKQPTRKLELEKEEQLLTEIAGFMPVDQRLYLDECFHSRDYENEHCPSLERIKEAIDSMPRTYEQEGKGDQAMVYLHYFTGGCDWWILEKDAGAPTDDPEDFQAQAFGIANIGYDADRKSVV